MTILAKRPNLPVFGDLMVDLLEDRFFEPMRRNHFASTPKANIIENENDYQIHLAAPGMKKENFAIDLKNNLLTISGQSESKTETKEEKTNFTSCEFNYSQFTRSFNLPKNAETSKIEANYADGILEIKVPKKEKEVESVHKIEVK
jgi:HSP20 family protein